MTHAIAQCVEALRRFVCEHERVVVHGAKTKPGLIGDRKVADIHPRLRVAGPLDMTRFSGIVEYDPGEFTFTAMAGTTLRAIDAALASHGQYLPFDPLFVDAGATIGGTVAAGLSGPGRFRYGGVRDFVIGVRFIDGSGVLIRGGGKVVKNAAGFDLPKLMVGSMGRLGVLVELTFKVFPRPQASATLRVTCDGLADALSLIADLGAGPWDFHAMDLDVSARLLLRLSGAADALPARVDRLAAAVAPRHCERLDGEAEATMWRAARELAWATAEAALIKVPLTPDAVIPLDGWLASHGAARRYSAAANVAWIALAPDQSLVELDGELARLQLRGMVVRGEAAHPLIGAPGAACVIDRVKHVLDPHDRFG